MRLSKIFIPAAILVVLLTGILSGCVPNVPEVIEVTGIDITEEDQTVKIGETLQLNAVFTPEDATNKTITWESDNTDVATVSEDGLVTALKIGKANITVTTEDGAFSDTIKITVIKASPLPTIKTYEVSFGAVELIEDIPNSINSRSILRRESTPNLEPNLSGVEINIFSDETRTNSAAIITTDDEGMATANLPAGTYYYNASKDGYADFPGIPEDTTNIWQYFLREILEVPETEISFTVPLEDSNEVMPCILLKVWPVTLTAVDEAYFGIAGISRNMTSRFQVPTLEEVSIEIYPETIFAIESLFRLEGTKEIVKKGVPEPMNPLMATLTTDNSGTAQINLPDGFYVYTAEKNGYDFIPDNIFGVIELERSKVPINIYDLFFVTGESTNVFFSMAKFWIVTFMDGETVYASQRVRDGNTAIKPFPNPTKEGYTFAGWSTTVQDSEVPEQLFNFETSTTEDITLYAQWTESPS